MYHELTVDFGVGLENRGMENRGLGAGESAFRCGLPFRGTGRLIRGAGSSLPAPAGMAGGELIKVDWSPDVSWRKRIRCAKR
jgi:hypothetical protein